MGFRRLAFLNFRNLADRELTLGARQVLLVGENGQGKTNLLEAVYLLAVASSFRERREEVLLRDPTAAAAVSGLYGDGGRGLERQLAVTWQQPGCRKEIRIDGKQASDRAQLLSEILCVCFVQEDMEMVAGSPEARRRLFDQTLSLAEPGWLELYRSYRQVLRARNLALRAKHEDLLDVYDEQIAPLGLEIMRKRRAVTAEFDAVFSPLVREIADGLEVTIRYRPSWSGLEAPGEVASRLGAERGRDLAAGITGTGPHRDHFAYLCAGREVSRYASTGQRRLCALVLRMAMARLLSERTARRPVLLLDDVLLELDADRKRAFVERFPDYDQAFFTFLPDENWLAYRGSDALVLTVANGELRV
jgi:DNA replication and repair protein RecF